MSKVIKAYGSWSSNLSPRSLSETLRLNDVQWDNATATLIWHEGRGAKGVLVAQNSNQSPRDLTSELSVRAQVGYGGGEFTVSHGQVYFAGPDGRLYQQSISEGHARPITPAFGAAASPSVSADGKWLLYIHSYEGTDGLALVDTDGSTWPRKFAFGTDFVMQPVWHPAGEYVAYIAWDHPQMPWDGTELRLVTLEYDRDGVPYPATTETIAGHLDTAIFQPEFSPNGRYLAYLSDESGWGQLYLYDIAKKTHTQLTTSEIEHSTPAWIQGLRVFGWCKDSQRIVFMRNVQGSRYLTWLDIERPENVNLFIGPGQYTDLTQVAVSPYSNQVAAIASSSKIPGRIITFEIPEMEVPPQLTLGATDPLSMQVLIDTPKSLAAQQHTIHRRSSTENMPLTELAEAEAISWTGHDGEAVFGLYYPPTNPKFEGSGAPPLLVFVHGGPTSQVTNRFQGETQFFSTRGFAVLQVNYRGSTGYGRAYMNKLRENWGLYDVEDSATGAHHLVERGLADPGKLVILGGSAGGFTVLQSLVIKPGFYKAGVCLFGVSNQFALAMDTHKFEARYTDSLLGPLPEASALYRERSPIFHAEHIVDPIIVFQGEDDKVVPRNQSDTIVDSLRARHVPHEYHVYAGEGHGWRKPETIEHYYNATLKFLMQHVVYA
ncbi:MAG: S9 family peptidase [Anaerolineae bacterium]